jgi:hypothetical protein
MIAPPLALQGCGGVTGTGGVLLACAHYACLDTLPDDPDDLERHTARTESR